MADKHGQLGFVVPESHQMLWERYAEAKMPEVVKRPGGVEVVYVDPALKEHARTLEKHWRLHLKRLDEAWDKMEKRRKKGANAREEEQQTKTRQKEEAEQKDIEPEAEASEASSSSDNHRATPPSTEACETVEATKYAEDAMTIKVA